MLVAGTLRSWPPPTTGRLIALRSTATRMVGQLFGMADAVQQSDEDAAAGEVRRRCARPGYVPSRASPYQCGRNRGVSAALRSGLNCRDFGRPQIRPGTAPAAAVRRSRTAPPLAGEVPSWLACSPFPWNGETCTDLSVEGLVVVVRPGCGGGGRPGRHALHVPSVDVLAVLHDHDAIVIDVRGQGSGVSPDGIFPGMLPILISTRRERGRLVVERSEQDKRDDADRRGCDERRTRRRLRGAHEAEHQRKR